MSSYIARLAGSWFAGRFSRVTPRGVQELSIASECVPNIGLRGRRRRIMKGLACLVLTAVVLIMLITRQAGTAAFLVLAPLTAVTAVYFFQAKEKT